METDHLLGARQQKQQSGNNSSSYSSRNLEASLSDLSHDEQEEGPHDAAETSSNFFTQMKHSVQESLRNSTAGEAVLTEYHHVKDALLDHLQDANHVKTTANADDNNDDFFLEMSLARNLSILPSKTEVIQAVEEVEDALGALQRNFSLLPTTRTHHEQQQLQQEEEDDDEDLPKKPYYYSQEQPSSLSEDDEDKRVPWSAYVTLACAVCALSSIGPFLAKQENVNATLKIVWRFQGTALLLAPLALRTMVLDGPPKLDVLQWGIFALAAASYAVLCVAFAMSIDYTTVSNATILTNSQSILLVAAKFCLGHKIILLEGLGVIIAFLGAVLCSRESAGLQDAPAHGWLSVWGDCLGVISSIGGIGYIVLGKSLRSSMSVLIFMVLNMTTASFLILFYMWLTEQHFSFDRHVDHGVFGWMNLQSDRLPLEIATVVVCNCLGTMGYVRAFKYFNSVIIAVAALLEPVVAAFTAVAMGVGVLPGVEGWIGNFLVIAGTLGVLYPTMQETSATTTSTNDGDDKMKMDDDTMPLDSTPPTPKTPKPMTRSPYPRMRSSRLKKMRAPPFRTSMSERHRNLTVEDQQEGGVALYRKRNNSADDGLP